MKTFTKFLVAFAHIVLMFAMTTVCRAQAPGESGNAQQTAKAKALAALENDVRLLPRSEKSAATTAAPAYKVAVYYVIPSDLAFEQTVFDRLVEATVDSQAWYQCATGGVTWELAFPEVVRVY